MIAEDILTVEQDKACDWAEYQIWQSASGENYYSEESKDSWHEKKR